MNPGGNVNTKNFDLTREVSIVLADRQGQPQAIRADSKGKPPTNIELLKVGMWRTPNHGDFMVTSDDLLEYIEHFDAGIGYVKIAGAPIDYKHENWDKAAGWIRRLYIEGDSLMGEVEWTPQGAQMLADGEFKCISPMFYPKGRGGWMDPEDYEHIVENVLVGAGLTNIPLFNGLKPIMASAAFDTKNTGNVFFISASQPKENPMDLATIRTKKAEELTEEEKTFVAENKDQLSADEQKAFGLEVTPPPADPKKEEEPVQNQPAPVNNDVPADVAASLKSGESMVIKASEWKATQEQLSDLRRKDIETGVKAHAARGAIKADQIAVWTDRIMKDTSMSKVLEDLPSNDILASTQGGDEATAGDATSIVDELKTKTIARVEASKGTLSYAQAQDALLREDKELAGRVEAARK